MSRFLTGMKANRAYRLHNTANGLLRLGDHEKALRKFAEARQLYEEAYAGGCRRRPILMAYSILLLRDGQFARAKDLILEINDQPKLSRDDKYQLRVNYAIAQWKLGNMETALTTIRKAYADRKSSVVYSALCMLLTEQAAATGNGDDYREAMVFAKEALEYDEEDASALDNMGQLLYHKSCRTGGSEAGRLRREGISWLEKALIQKPDQVTSLYFLAKLCLAEGDREKAAQWAEKAEGCFFTAMCQVTRDDITALKQEIAGES